MIDFKKFSPHNDGSKFIGYDSDYNDIELVGKFITDNIGNKFRLMYSIYGGISILIYKKSDYIMLRTIIEMGKNEKR